MSGSQNHALLGDELLLGFEHLREGAVTAVSHFGFLHLRNFEVFAVAVFGRSTELEETFCDVVGLGCDAVIEAFELNVEIVEVRALYVPVEVAEVGVVNLHVGEELTKCGNDGLNLLCVEESVIECAHCFAMF